MSYFYLCAFTSETYAQAACALQNSGFLNQ